MTLSSCGFQHSGSERSVEEAADTLKAVNTKLEILNQKQGIISVSSRQVETISNVAENRRIQSRIIRNIALIDSVMSDNRVRIRTLEKKIYEDRRQIAGLEQELSEMQKNIEVRQLETERFRIGMERSGITIAGLHDSLRAVYLIAAKTDSLVKWNIIEKNGGIPHLFGNPFRLSGYMPLKKFIRLDRMKTSRIVIPASAGNIMVMTLHDRNAYVIRKSTSTEPDLNRQTGGASCTLVITDPDKFWALSNALVIKIDN
jgi:hypothetical protein